MSFTKYLRRKTHKYETQADLQNMSAEDILRIDPDDIGFYIKTETGGVPLTGVKKLALDNLLAYKEQSKKLGKNEAVRERNIQSFLTREGIVNDPEVDRVIEAMALEIIRKINTRDYELADLKNKLRGLYELQPKELTEDEKIQQFVYQLRKLETPTELEELEERLHAFNRRTIGGTQTKRRRRAPKRKATKRKRLSKRKTHKRRK